MSYFQRISVNYGYFFRTLNFQNTIELKVVTRRRRKFENFYHIKFSLIYKSIDANTSMNGDNFTVIQGLGVLFFPKERKVGESPIFFHFYLK